jgi:Skp family chaperone for outer membrane proteins
MNAIHKNWPATVLAAAFLAFLAVNGPGRPSSVATVNLEQIFQGLDLRLKADEQLVKVAGELDARAAELRGMIDDKKADLDIFPKGSTKHQQTLSEVARLSYQLQAHLDFAIQKLDFEKSITLRRIYGDIKAAVSQLAQTNGYDIVVVDDSVVSLPTDANETETMRQISARRLLFTNNGIDITKDVIAYMNK